MTQNLKNKLIYRSSHRGCRENDWLLSAFVKQNTDILPQRELESLDILLQEDDPDLFGWITKKVQPPIKYKDLVQKIINFNEYKQNIDQ